MERNSTGKSPRMPRYQDDSYADYLTAVRNFAIKEWFPGIAADVATTVDAAGMADNFDNDALGELIDARANVASWKRLMRSQQQMTWAKCFESYSRNRDAWEAKLADAERTNPGRLHRQPDLTVPDYACEDIHLQPGGYCRDELAGYVFHHGTRVFYQGENDADEHHDLYASLLKPPADGKLSSILDLGCSIGQGTTALKARYPDATITGVDIGLPLLRYAHMRATELGSDVHFQHALAEALPFADGSQDAVFAFILFHEVPEASFTAILDEAHRVLRPGGTFTVVDAPNSRALPAPNRMWLAFDAKYNCEPYSPAFVASDFKGMLDTAGFVGIEQQPTPTFLSLTTAAKAD